MSTLKAVRLVNLRCFSDTGFVQICPITILVGRNSAGKSTFARLFPLLRQSAEEEKRSPILWFGRLVDFGNFQTAVNRAHRNSPIELSFKVALSPDRTVRYGYAPYWFGPGTEDATLAEEGLVTATIRLQPKEHSASCYASYIKLELFGNACEIFLTDSEKLSEMRVNGLAWIPNEQNQHAVISQLRIFPSLNFIKQFSRKTEQGERKYWQSVDPFRLTAREAAYQAVASRKMKGDTVDRIVATTAIGYDEAILNSLQTNPQATKHFRSQACQLTSNNQYFRNLKAQLYFRAIPFLLTQLDKNLAAYVEGVRYIEPLRATAQRYYRLQELAVDELDSKGTNVAMFIDSLTESERGRLNSWLSNYFGVNLKGVNEGGHVALELQRTDSMTGTNLADLGFGFSQLLPIVLQLWHSAQPALSRSRRAKQPTSSTVVIEQPELHLHPAYQAQIADVMVASIDSAKEQQREITIVAETHSSYLINRLGLLVEKGLLKASDVQIVLFEQDESLEKTTVRATQFDATGVLVDWPYGFFEPER